MTHHHLQKKWIFTWLSGNATNKEGIPDKDGKEIFYELPSIDKLKNLLDSISQEAVFQLEKGETTGRLHYQGRLTLLGSRKGVKALLKIFSDIGEVKLLTFDKQLNYDHDEYCTKDDTRIENFGIELSSQEVPLQVLSSIYNVSQLSSKWISVVPLSTLKTPKQKSTF